MITIRKMKAEDVEAVLSLRLSWLSVEFGVQETTELVHRWFSAYPDNPLAFAFVAADDEQIVGYILCALVSHPAMRGQTGEIDEIYVTDDYRRQDIGQQLVNQARMTFQSSTDELTIIRARVDHENSGAQAFWRAVGYEYDVLEYKDYLE